MNYDPKAAVRHIVHDYIYLIAAGTDTQRPLQHPFNHYAERTFLVHCRSMAVFFSGEKGKKDICALHFTRGPFQRSLPTLEKWGSHINIHLTHLTRGRITNKSAWTGEPNKYLLQEFRAVWNNFIGDLKGELKPLFTEEIEQHRRQFTNYPI